MLNRAALLRCCPDRGTGGAAAGDILGGAGTWWPRSGQNLCTTLQLHEELHGGRMLPENKQVLGRLFDAKQTQAEFTGRALLSVNWPITV